MRRLVYWYLPLAVALTATVLFASGFYSFLRGDLGTPVDLLPRKSSAAQQPQSVIAPIILGDSVARGTGDTSGLGIGGRLDHELRLRNIRAKRTVNIAVNGARTFDLLQELAKPNVQTIIGQSNVVIISIGGNDLGVITGVARTGPPRNFDQLMNDVLDRMSEAVKRVREANPKTRIFLVGLYNPFASGPFGPQLTTLVNRWNAKLIERFADDMNVTVVPTADLFLNHDRLAFDRFHPGDEGYALIARRIADAI